MSSSRDLTATSGAPRGSLPAIALPPLCCDLCSWPISANEIARQPDGSILGLIVCTQCIEDQLEARAYEQAAY